MTNSTHAPITMTTVGKRGYTAVRNMADSVQIDQPQGRPVGGSITTGRIHKGHGKTAASCSIPSKFQTIVTDNSEKKGFMSKSRRFPGDTVNENPGPGRYGQLESIESRSTSFSKKGFGSGFVSKAKRFHKAVAQLPSGPGPGQYDPLPPKENYFNKSSVTSNFHLPIAVKRDNKDKDGVPAPNQYQVGQITGRVAYQNNVAACAAFRSRSKRDWKPLAAGPSPCHYTIRDSLIGNAPKTVSAPFKSTTERKMMTSPQPFPGPGAYKPYEDADRKLLPPRQGFLNKHYLCISAPAMPIPPVDPTPGPGHYEIVDYEGPTRHYMSGSVFVSSTSRWSGDILSNEDSPGPATYRPQAMGKQSFIYNANSRWI